VSTISITRSLAGLLAVFAILAIATVPAAPAAGSPPLADFHASPHVLSWQPLRQATEWTLRVAAPGGEVVAFASRGAAPTLTLQELADRLGDLPDGSYTWELSAALDVDPGTGRELRDARAQGLGKPPWVLEESRSLRQSGGFRVVDGRFHYDPDAVEPEVNETSELAAQGFDALRGVGVEPAADHAIFTTSGPFGPNGHGITDSLCVGAGCTTSEDYGTDTIRMRESNLRIAFDDSSTGTFPLRDWEILANDQADGGLERFSIRDVTTDDFPFTIEGASPEDALYIDDQGRVGMGTATPDQRLHVRHGDTPGIVLEQDTTQSFTARTWELAGNDGEFFLRDATAGSLALPLRIAAGAPRDSLVLSSDGKIGVGTDAPTNAIHVTGDDGATAMVIEETHATPDRRILLRLRNNGRAALALTDDDMETTWTLDNQHLGFGVSLSGSGFREFMVTNSGSVEILENAIVGNRVGVGTGTPTHPVHVVGSDGSAQIVVEENSTTVANRTLLELENNGQVTLALRRTDGADSWLVKALNGGFSVSTSGAASNQLQVGSDGAMRITDGSGNGLMALDASGNLILAGSLTQGGSPLRYQVEESEASGEEVDRLRERVATLEATVARLEALLTRR
jgi:hypothetical protein